MPRPIAKSLHLNIELQPKEMQFLEMMDGPYDTLGYGGSRGGAKSHCARCCAIVRRMKYPGTKALIFRRTFGQLQENHIFKLMTEMPDLYKQCWSSENKALMLPNDGMVLFRYADTLKDVLEFRGKEYDDVYIDEATDLDEQEINILDSCARSTKTGVQAKTVLTFNPGGKGHAYVKRVFINKDLTDEEKIKKYGFLQAYAWDNIYWVLAALRDDGIDPPTEYYRWPRDKKIDYLISRSDYGRKLNALPESLRRGWLYGDWDEVAGMQFSEFRRDLHSCKTFKIPSWWECWGSNDPGFNDPGVWYLHASDHDGNVHTFKEFYFDSRMTYSEQSRAVAGAIAKERLPQPSYWVTGMDAFAQDPETKKTIVDYYMEGGLFGFIKPDHGKGARARMAATCHEYLRPYKDNENRTRTKWRIHDTCPKLIETLPSLPTDINEPEAAAECAIDHAYQAAGYGLQSRHGSPDQPKAKYNDGTMGAIDGSNRDEDADDVDQATRIRQLFKSRDR